MSAQVVRSSIHVASKDYIDSSHEYIYELIEDFRHYKKQFKDYGFTFSELRAIARLKANKWRIKKGQRYERSFVVDGGDHWDFKSLPEIIAICQNHDLYPDN